MNIADANYAQFAHTPVVDILLQVFGDDTLYNTDGSGKNVMFREGALGTELAVSGGIVPPGANNGHWNWILFSITNAINPDPQNTSGPEMYATDSSGGTAVYNGPLYMMTGTGLRLKLAFWIQGVDLAGVNTSPFTGGPRLVFNGGFHFIDKIELGVVRSGDLRLSLRPDSGDPNLQFQILNSVFGPSYQDNTRASMRLTYYDDPALVGASLRPQVYSTSVNGLSQIIPPPAPYNTRATLTGTRKWLEAYFELPNVNFQGVNQGPQSLVRFQTTRAVSSDPAAGNVHVSRVRYDIMRPCGPYIGINMLQALSIDRTNNQPSLSWFGSATLMGSPTVSGTYNGVLSVTNIATNTYAPPTLQSSQFFRLKFPPLP